MVGFDLAECERRIVDADMNELSARPHARSCAKCSALCVAGDASRVLLYEKKQSTIAFLKAAVAYTPVSAAPSPAS